MTQKTNQNPWTMDVRVRERNLKSGALTEKDLEKQLAALPDVSDQAESFGTSQPALVQPPVAPMISESVVDDEPLDDEDEEDEIEEVAAVAQPGQPSHDTNGAGTGAVEVTEADVIGGDSGGGGDVGGGGSEGEQP